MTITDFTAFDLQDEKLGPVFLDKYSKQVTKRMKNDKNVHILAVYDGSLIQDLESFLRTEVDLVEGDIRLVLDENISSLIAHEIKPYIYTFKDHSEFLSRFLRLEFEGLHNEIDIEFDEFSIKTKRVVGAGLLP